MEINMTFGEKLVILRKKYGRTQDELAKALGVSRQAVYKWECGQSYPEVPKLLEIKLLFNISIDNLLDDTYEIALPEKKKRKRLSKETIKKIEESVEEGNIGSIVANSEVTKIIEAAMNETEEKPVKEEPVTEEAPVAAEPVAEEVKEPVAVAAVKEETAPASESAPTAEPSPAPAVETVEQQKDVKEEYKTTEKKVGFFGRIFGKK